MADCSQQCSHPDGPRFSPEQFGIGRLFWQIPEAVVVGEATTGRIVLWNPAAEAIFGYPAIQAVGHPIEMLISEALRPAHRAGLARYAATGHGVILESARPVEVPARHSDGTDMVVELSLSPLLDISLPGRYVLALIRDVTARRRLEQEAVRTAEERFTQTFAHAPFAVQLLSPNGTTRRVNPAWEALWGVTLDQLAGYNLRQDPQLMAAGVMPAIERAFAGVPAVLPPVRYTPAQSFLCAGTVLYRWVQGMIYPVTDDTGQVREVVLIHEDITARTEAEAALAQQLQLMETISANATLGLVLMDARQHCTFMNPAAEALTGYTLAEVQGQPLHAFVHHARPDSRPYPLTECPIDRALPTRQREQGEEVFVHKDGHFYPVAFTASPILAGGVPVGTVIEVQDITARKQAEAEREALLAQEQAARQAAEAAVALRDEFLSMAAHELRTPLTPLRGSLQLLRRALARGLPAAEVDRLIERAERQELRLTRLVIAMLDAARLEQGTLRVERARLNLSALVRQVVATERDSWTPPRVLVLEEAPEPRTDIWVDGDDLRLEQVLVNLLENARKFSPLDTPITVRMWATDGQAHLAVQDEGIGIPVEEQAAILGRFQRGSNIDPHIAGFGLGLYLVRQIVTAHGGGLQITSATGEGSTFTITLPSLP